MAVAGGVGGNGLSWAYTFEWPVFAAIACVAWWHLIHEDPAEREARSRRQPAEGDDWAEIDAVDADRVAAAARRELDEHLGRLAGRRDLDA